MNCGDAFETERGISKLNTRVTARVMKANVLTIVVNFGLSDSNDPDFQEHCAHQHTLSGPQCDDNTSCFEKIRHIVKDGKTLSVYTKEQQDNLFYDIKKTSDAINQWKARYPRKA